MKSFCYRILCGFCLGISVFAPGISGSIMAIILGIYDKIIDITSNPLKNLKNNIKFVFPMGIGAAISLVLFVLVFSYLFETYEKATYLLFIGLIAGNLPMIFKEANKSKFSWLYLIGAIAAFACAFTMGVLSKNITDIQETTGQYSLIYLALCGAVAGFAALIPGMSISMILIVMGVYSYLIEAAKSIDIIIITVVGTAFTVAMILSSRLIKFIFKRFCGMANNMVLGFLVGSIGGIACIIPTSGSNLIGLLILIIGLAVSLLFVFLGKKVNID